MRMVLPTSIPTAKKVDVSPAEVSFDAFYNNTAYYEMLLNRSVQGYKIFHFGVRPCVCSDIAVSYTAFTSQEDKQGIMIDPRIPNTPAWSYDYESACCNSNSDVIVISNKSYDNVSGDLVRIAFIKALVDSGKFCTGKLHWLFGISNPAELSLYPLLFTNFILSRLEYAICSMCYIYSVYNIRFSSSKGIVEELPTVDTCDFRDLGLTSYLNYDLDKDQLRCFYMNVELVQQFCNGRKAEIYIDRTLSKLEEIYNA